MCVCVWMHACAHCLFVAVFAVVPFPFDTCFAVSHDVFDVCSLSLTIASFVFSFLNIKADFRRWREFNSRRVSGSRSEVSWIHLPKFHNRNVDPEHFTKTFWTETEAGVTFNVHQKRTELS